MRSPNSYGDWWADIYDEYFPPERALEPSAAVRFLATHAGAGPALELGVGTGRLAIPLAAEGFPVHGMDASSMMLERLRAKDPTGRVVTFLADCCAFSSDYKYSLIYAAYNTVLMVGDREDQMNLFRCCSNSVAPHGTLVIEAELLDLEGFYNGVQFHLSHLNADELELRVAEHRPVEQRLDFQHVFLRQGTVRIRPVTIRYTWPSELDLMANLAGFSLRSRFGSWCSDPFDRTSRSHISVYTKHP